MNYGTSRKIDRRRFRPILEEYEDIFGYVDYKIDHSPNSTAIKEQFAQSDPKHFVTRTIKTGKETKYI